MCVLSVVGNTQIQPTSGFSAALNSFLPQSGARPELQRFVLAASWYLNALSCWHVIGGRAHCANKQLDVVANKAAA